jgi:hypothetical protein
LPQQIGHLLRKAWLAVVWAADSTPGWWVSGGLAEVAQALAGRGVNVAGVMAQQGDEAIWYH